MYFIQSIHVCNAYIQLLIFNDIKTQIEDFNQNSTLSLDYAKFSDFSGNKNFYAGISRNLLNSNDSADKKTLQQKKKRYVVVVFRIYEAFQNRVGTWLNVNVYFTTTILYTTLEHSTYYRISKYKKITIYLCFDIRTSCFVHVANR
jgi:hypothetical protein